MEKEARVSGVVPGKMGNKESEARVLVSATQVVGQVYSKPKDASPIKDKVCNSSDSPSQVWVPIPCIDLLRSYVDKKAYSLHSNAIIGELWGD